jgi:hypothetical protein
MFYAVGSGDAALDPGQLRAETEDSSAGCFLGQCRRSVYAVLISSRADEPVKAANQFRIDGHPDAAETSHWVRTFLSELSTAWHKNDKCSTPGQNDRLTVAANGRRHAVLSRCSTRAIT